MKATVDMSLAGLPINPRERKTALLKRWRTIILLLRFVLSIGKGHPTLEALGRTNTKKETLKSTRSFFKILEAVAHILVREHEIVAVTAFLATNSSKFGKPSFATPVIQLTAVVVDGREPSCSDEQISNLKGRDSEVQGTTGEGEQTDSWVNQMWGGLRRLTSTFGFTLVCAINQPAAREAEGTPPPSNIADSEATCEGVSHMPIISEEGPWKALGFK